MRRSVERVCLWGNWSVSSYVVSWLGEIFSVSGFKCCECVCNPVWWIRVLFVCLLWCMCELLHHLEMLYFGTTDDLLWIQWRLVNDVHWWTFILCFYMIQCFSHMTHSIFILASSFSPLFFIFPKWLFTHSLITLYLSWLLVTVVKSISKQQLLIYSTFLQSIH